jgi:hypothetical protein
VLRLLLVLTLSASVVATACSDDESEPEPTPSPAAERTAAPTPSVAQPTAGAATTEPDANEIEVQGVVGTVDARSSTIEIRATGGSPITTIEVGGDTAIRRASGGNLTLAEVRPSDRITARGVEGSAPDSLLANEITVQQVVPGGPPGANPGG